MLTQSLLGALLALAPASVATAQEPVLKETDLKKLGETIGDYFEARDESKGINEAFLDVARWIERTESRAKRGSCLAWVEDWEQAFYLVRLDNIEFRGARGKIATSRVDVAGDKLALTHRVPSKIGKDPYPLIITIPDAGVAPERHLETLFTQADQLETALVIAVQMPVNADVWNNFAPQEESGVGSVMTTYGAALQALPVDMNRVFLDGTGAGVGAAFATAAAFPHLFAGVIARGEGTPGAPANFGHIATLFMGGGDAAQGFADALRGLGYENCTLNAEGGEADVWAWIKEQKRASYPAELAFVPSSAYTRTSYWISVEGVDVDGGAKLNARADREANTIDIQAEGIESLRIYFNDRLVDMDRPVRVVINGVASEAVVARNAKTMLDLVYQSGDWGRVFANMQPYDVKGK